MRPAFTSTRQAAGFAGVVLLILLLPLLLGKRHLPSREQIYAAYGWRFIPFPWLQQAIFHETNDIDMVILGSSHIYAGLNAPFAQEELSRHLGRPAVVRSISWGSGGPEPVYFILKDLLAHRKVKMIVTFDETGLKSNDRNSLAKAWFRYGDNLDDLAGLPWWNQASYYFAAVLGAPKNLLALVRTNQPLDPKGDGDGFYLNPIPRLGTAVRQVSIDQPFTSYLPVTAARPSDFVIYSPATSGLFVFSNSPPKAWELFFQRKFLDLAASNGCQVVLLHLPNQKEKAETVIYQNQVWPGIPMLGIPTARLFAGLTDRQLDQLFFDPMHLNQNGQMYFTKLVLPSLITLYDKQNRR